MARAKTLLLLAAWTVVALLLAAPAKAQDDATGSGGAEAGESANTWGGVAVWIWALVIVAGFGLLLGLLFYATRGSGDAGAPPPRATPPPRADTDPARDLAIATFPHLDGAERAFAVARVAAPDAPWLGETTFLEAHRHGSLVVRGTFAGRYLSAEAPGDSSLSGAVARTVAQAALEDLGVEVPSGSSALLVYGSAEAVDEMVGALDGHDVVRRRISDKQAAALQAVAEQAPPAAPLAR